MCGLCGPAPLSRRSFLGLAVGAAAAVAWVPSAGATGGVVEPAPGLRVLPRGAWGDSRPPTGPLAPEDDVRFLLVHHTASDTVHRSADVPALLRRYFDLHTGPSKGWPDLAYNFVIDREGGVWEGRAGSLAGPVRGDATGGNQGFDQLVCLIGDFTSVLPTPAAQASLTRVLAWLADRHAISTAEGASATFVSRGSNRWPAGARVTVPTISGHRQLSETACPGAAFFPLVRDELPARVQAQRDLRPHIPATTATAAVPTTATAPAPTRPATTTAPLPEIPGPTTTTGAIPVAVAAPPPVPERPRDRTVAAVPAAAGLALAAAATGVVALRRRRPAPAEVDPAP